MNSKLEGRDISMYTNLQIIPIQQWEIIVIQFYAQILFVMLLTLAENSIWDAKLKGYTALIEEMQSHTFML